LAGTPKARTLAKLGEQVTGKDRVGFVNSISLQINEIGAADRVYAPYALEVRGDVRVGFRNSPGFDSSVGGRTGSGEEEPERGRAHVLRSHSGGFAGPHARADEDEQRLDEGRQREVAADLAALASALEQRN
jgi:hypothetical protein